MEGTTRDPLTLLYRVATLQLPYKVDVWLSLSGTGQGFWHETNRFPTVANFKVISFLQNRSCVIGRAEISVACQLTNEPLTMAIGIFQIELRITLIGNPHSTSWHAFDPAKRDEQRCYVFVIAGTLL